MWKSAHSWNERMISISDQWQKSVEDMLLDGQATIISLLCFDQNHFARLQNFHTCYKNNFDGPSRYLWMVHLKVSNGPTVSETLHPVFISLFLFSFFDSANPDCANILLCKSYQACLIMNIIFPLSLHPWLVEYYPHTYFPSHTECKKMFVNPFIVVLQAKVSKCKNWHLTKFPSKPKLLFDVTSLLLSFVADLERAGGDGLLSLSPCI